MSDTESRTGKPPGRLSELPSVDPELVSTSPEDAAIAPSKRDIVEERIARRRDEAAAATERRIRQEQQDRERQEQQVRDAASALATVARRVPADELAPRRAQTDEPAPIQLLPSFPQSDRAWSWGAILVFALMVIAPTVIAGLYYFKYAANQYVTEFHFVIRNSSSGNSQPSAASMISSVLGTSSIAESGENYLVTDYLTSRQAAEELQSKIAVKTLYSRPEADRWARFDASLPMEKFVTYWRKMISANYDQITGIATAQVRAFTPADAHLIATTLLKLAEDLVNDISDRPRREAIAFAEKEVRRAEDRLKAIRGELSKFRSTENVIDPTAGVVNTNTTLVQSLRQTLAQLQTDLGSLTRQQISPTSPQVVVLQSRIKSVREQLATIESQVGKPSEGAKALAHVVGSYEQLDLERQFAQNLVVSTMQTLEQTRATAMTQRIFITPYVRPAVPETSTYPNRLVSTLTVAAAAFIIWIIGFLLFRSMREHIV